MAKRNGLCLVILILSTCFVEQNEAGFFDSLRNAFHKVGNVVGSVARTVGTVVSTVGNIAGAVAPMAARLAPMATMIPGIGPEVSMALSGVGTVAKVCRVINGQKKAIAAVHDAITSVNYATENVLSTRQKRSTENWSLKLKQALADLPKHGKKLVGHGTAPIQEMLYKRSLTQSERLGANVNPLGVTNTRTQPDDGNLHEVLTDNKKQELMQMQTIGSLNNIQCGADKRQAKESGESMTKIFGLGDDIGVIHSAAHSVSEKVDSTIEKLEALARMESKISANQTAINRTLVLEISRYARDIEHDLNGLTTTIDDSIETIDSTMDGLSQQMIASVHFVEGNLEDLSKTMRDGFASVILELLEMQTEEARECYRRIKQELYGVEIKGKPVISYMLNPARVLIDPEVEREMKGVLTVLKDRQLGVDRCWHQYIAVYNPAGGLVNARDIFIELLEYFSTKFPTRKSWESDKAVAQLKSVQIIRNQLMMVMTDLFTWKSMTTLTDHIVASAEMDAITTGLDATLVDLNSEFKVINTHFYNVNPLCPATEEITIAIAQHKLICDDDVYKSDDQYGNTGFHIGTMCHFTCLGDKSELEHATFICGHQGNWSFASNLVFKKDLRLCVSQSNGVAEMERQMQLLIAKIDGKLAAPSSENTVNCNVENENKPFSVVAQDHFLYPHTQCFNREHNRVCIRASRRAASWADANHTCQMTNGMLVSITQPEFNEPIVSLVASLVSTPFNVNRDPIVWIGLMNANAITSGSWIWSDGTRMSFDQWDSDQPTNMNGNQNCASLWLQTGRWHDHECSAEMNFFCQFNQ